MSRLHLEAFSSDHLAEAGRLLAERHARQRTVEPLLSARYEDPVTAEAEVRKIWEAEGASGAVSLIDGRVTGYLVGAPKASSLWGPNVWIEAAGHAVTEAEHVRDLYGFAAARWVDEGLTAQYTVVPAHDKSVVESWYRLGFGQQHMHGIQQARTTSYEDRSGVQIRRARRDDIPSLAALELALPQHQGLSPVFSAGTSPTLEEAIEEWESDFDDPAYAVFVAEHDGAVIGSALGCSVEKSNTHAGLTRPDSAGFLGFAAVFPEHRGLGAGRALGEAVISWASETGYPSIVTDWRVTNLLSSRTWPALGFHDTFVRVHRVVGY